LTVEELSCASPEQILDKLLVLTKKYGSNPSSSTLESLQMEMEYYNTRADFWRYVIGVNVIPADKTNQAKKSYAGSLSKEEIEKETSAVIDYYNAYLKNSTKFNYRWIRKICFSSRQKGPKKAGEAMTRETYSPTK
jgi:G:T/U-mismatch repair DNA glycosylase